MSVTHIVVLLSQHSEQPVLWNLGEGLWEIHRDFEGTVVTAKGWFILLTFILSIFVFPASIHVEKIWYETQFISINKLI